MSLYYGLNTKYTQWTGTALFSAGSDIWKTLGIIGGDASLEETVPSKHAFEWHLAGRLLLSLYSWPSAAEQLFLTLFFHHKVLPYLSSKAMGVTDPGQYLLKRKGKRRIERERKVWRHLYILYVVEKITFVSHPSRWFLLFMALSTNLLTCELAEETHSCGNWDKHYF